MATIPPRLKIHQFSAGQIAAAAVIGGFGFVLLAAAQSITAKLAIALLSTMAVLLVLFAHINSFALTSFLLAQLRFAMSARHFVWRRGPAPAARRVRFISQEKRQRLSRETRLAGLFLARKVGTVLMAAISVLLVIVALVFMARWAATSWLVIQAPSALAIQLTPTPAAPPSAGVYSRGSPGSMFLPVVSMDKTTQVVLSLAEPTATPIPAPGVWECPGVPYNQGVNDYVAVANPGASPAVVAVLISHGSGLKVKSGFTLSAGENAVILLTPPYVIAPAVSLQSDASLSVQCHVVYWNNPATSYPKARLWLFSPVRVDNLRLWFVEIFGQVDAQAYALYEERSAGPLSLAGQRKAFLYQLFGNDEGVSGYLLVGDQPFTATSIWH